MFVSALRDALLAGEIDVAVHSFKDLPTAPADGIVVAAVPVREDPRDALVARDGLTLGELPAGARGRHRLAAARRAAARARARASRSSPIRGNVDTRLGKVAAGEVDAVVLAYAGLRRLGRGVRGRPRCSTRSRCCRRPRRVRSPSSAARPTTEALAVLAALDDADTRAAVPAERALLAALEAGCSAPVGALAEIAEGETGPEVFLRGSVTAVDGSDAVRLSATGPTTDAEAVGRRLAADLLAEGADQIDGEFVMTSRAQSSLGRITFVGAGPGDPGLLAGHASDALDAPTSWSPTPACRGDHRARARRGPRGRGHAGRHRQGAAAPRRATGSPSCACRR